jgi:TPR repeat protein
MPLLLFLVLLGLGCTSAPAAPEPGAALQAELEAAVGAYEAGLLAQARAAFESLARRHVAAADYNLAVMQLRGEGQPADPRRAEQRLRRAARAGFVTAQFMLARALESGAFGRRDLASALHWYEQAATAGSVEAMVEMGTAHYLGRGRPHDAARAAHWYRLAAQGGDVGAMFLLASMLEQGDGVGRDLRLARYWYDLAARQGDEAAPGKVRELDARAAASE